MKNIVVVVSAALLVLGSGCASVPKAAFDGDGGRVADYVRTSPGAVQERFEEGECSRCTLLHYAAGNQEDDVEVVRVLLDAGADPNALDGHGATPLHAACASQNPAVTRYLLAHGAQASLYRHDEWGNTPLHLASARVRERERTTFIAAGAVSGTERADVPSEEIVTALLDAGADLGARTKKGNTALHLAAYRGYAGVVSLLLARGADRTTRNDAGLTPEVLASQYRQDAVMRLLREGPAAP